MLCRYNTLKLTLLLSWAWEPTYREGVWCFSLDKISPYLVLSQNLGV